MKRSVDGIKQRAFLEYIFFRRGITHISVLMSSFTAITVFYSASRDWVFFSSLGYMQIMGLGALILLPVVRTLGRYDYQKGGLFSNESALAVERNPYSFDKFTEKERLYLAPVTIDTANVTSRLCKALTNELGLSDPLLLQEVRKLEASTKLLKEKITSNGANN